MLKIRAVRVYFIYLCDN